MGPCKITILCYADDAVPTADNEDDLTKTKIISPDKRKCMVINKEPKRHKVKF